MASVGELVTLLSNASTTGSAKGPIVGGRYVFSVVGTFGGTTVQLQFLGPDNTTWISLASGSFTAAGAVAVDVPNGAAFRVTVTGGSPSGLYAALQRVPL